MTEHRPASAPTRRPASNEPRRPYHVGVLIGLSTGAYALSLAAVTTLQVASDQVVIAEREPMQDAIGLLAEHHALLEARLEAARHGYQEASGGYDDLADRLLAVHERIERLGKAVITIEDSTIALPGSLDLPKVRRITAAQVTSAPPAPPIHATTGASGKK